MKKYYLTALIVPSPFQHQLEELKGDFTSPLSGLPVWMYAKFGEDRIDVIVDSEDDLELSTVASHALVFVNGVMHLIAFVFGDVYTVEINHVVCEEDNIDQPIRMVSGEIAERNEKNRVDNTAYFNHIQEKVRRAKDLRVKRCLRDLMLALKYPSDCALYCFRALEFLRHECRIQHGISNNKKGRSKQWEKLREITGHNEDEIKFITDTAKKIRHGEDVSLTQEQIGEILSTTWDVVEKFLEKRK